MTHRHLVPQAGAALWRCSGLVLLLPMMLIVLLDSARYGEAACALGVIARDVNESTLAGYSIEDLDSSYQLSATPTIDPTYACYFEISTSALRLKKPFDLENFTSCLDGTTISTSSVPSTVTIAVPCSAPSTDTATFLVRLVDINEFPPTFQPSTFLLNVSEATAVNTMIIQLNSYVTDRDKNSPRIFNFLIVNGSLGDFTMNLDGVTSGVIRISRALDYDFGTRQYVMSVSAADLASEPSSLPMPLTGYATVIVNVIDADDRNPFFTQPSYTLYFMENDTSYVNRSLTTTPPLEARDGDVGINQTINYAIDSGFWSKSNGSLLGSIPFLSINKNNGQLTVLIIVDREALPSSQLFVQVKGYQIDNPDTRVTFALVLVTVGDKNDNAPVMDATLYNVSVAENSLVDSYVTVVRATDADLGENATVAYSLNDTFGAFKVDPISGRVSVANPSLLDREATPSFVMTVWAQESATPEQFRSPVSILIVNLIDVNDNSPVFSPPNATYAFLVSGDAPVGSVVGNVTATDADQGDNGLVRFSVAWAGGASGSLFQLDALTGVLTTRASLSGFPPGTYVLQVVAEDQANPASARRQSRAIVQITVSLVSTTAAATSTTTGGSSTSDSSTAGSTSQTAVPAYTSTTLLTTTTSGNLSTSTLSTPVSVGGSAATSSVQIVLIVLCAILLFIIVVLVALTIWCWKQRQRPPSDAAQTTAGNGVGGHELAAVGGSADAAAAAASAAASAATDVTTLENGAASTAKASESYALQTLGQANHDTALTRVE